ncbi:L-tyrosine aminotransferase [Aureococcus anophagefferens]|nr:L-tyrosine aminotransferase [Aureococcus anophagefferens]
MNSWQPIPMSGKAARTKNQIRAVVESVLAGRDTTDLLDLSLGDPTAFGLTACPKVVADAVAAAVADATSNGYACAAGTAARAALAFAVLLSAGDNVLVPSPGFPLYATLAESLGAEVRYYGLDSAKGWDPDVAGLDALIDGRTKAIVVNSPSNPCGAVHSLKALRGVVAVAAANRLPIVSDEIYKDLVFEDAENSCSLADVAVGACPVLAVDGLAKTSAVPGWRVGWIVLHDSVNALGDVREGLARLATLILGASTLAQAAIPVALSREPALRAAVERHTTALVSASANAPRSRCRRAAPGLRAAPPKAAMYVLVELGAPLAARLRDGGRRGRARGGVPCSGACFGAPNAVRLVACASAAATTEAAARLAAFASRHSEAEAGEA